MGTKRGTLAAASMDKGEAKSMESIRFLHCADLHLGAELSSLGNLASSRREELFMTFERILSICREEKPDFLLMAGDVFDTDAPEPSLSLRVKEGLASIPETQVIIAPGNHDYLSARSPYLTQWSPNVHIFSRDVYCFPFPEKGVYVYGAGFTASYEPEPLLMRIPPEKEGAIRLGVLHGDLLAASGYNPVSEGDLRKSGLHYVALGHVHQPSPTVLRAGKTAYAYSGSPEGCGFDELGARGIYGGSILPGGKVEASFRPICRRIYAAAPVDISGFTDPAAQEETVLSSLRKEYGENFAQNIYKIYLRGNCSLTPEGLHALGARLSDSLYFCKLRDQTAPQEDWEALSQETSLKGMFVKEMLKRLGKAKTKEELERNRQALRFGLKALEGEVEGDED